MTKLMKESRDHDVYRGLNADRSGVYHLCGRELCFKKIVYKCMQQGNEIRDYSDRPFKANDKRDETGTFHT